MVNWLEQHLLPCAWKSLLGLDCPLCGFQRSFIALLKGDVTASFHFYPPLLPVLIFLSMLALHLLNKQWISQKIIVNSATLVLGIIFVSYGIKMAM